MVAVAAVLMAACSSSKPPKGANADKLVSDGLAAQRAGNLGRALQDYEAAVRVNPADYVAFYDEGVVHQTQGDVPAAIAAYQKSVQANGRYKPALFNLAIAETPGSPYAAAAVYENLNQLDPHDPNVLLNLGLLLLKLGQRPQAAADLVEAVKLNPSFASRVPSIAVVPHSVPSSSTSTTTPASKPASSPTT